MKNVQEIKLIPIFLTIFILFGCNNKDDGKESKLALMKRTQPTPINIVTKNEDHSISKQVKNEVLKNKTIYDAAVIEMDKKILVSYKVKHFYRFKMKSIEKKLNNQLENRYPDRNFIVSSDYKIFLECVRLKEAVKQNSISEKEAKKRFKQIVSLSEELT